MDWPVEEQRKGERRMEEPKTWWEGNSTRFWRLLIIGYLGIVGFFLAWGFEQLTTIPVIYPTKTEINRLVDKMEFNFNKLGDKIDNYMYTTTREQRR